MYKNGWLKITDARVLKIYNEIIQEARFKGYLQSVATPPLYTRKKMSSLGVCYAQKTFFGSELAILLNKELFNFSDEQIRSVIVHEVAHAIVPGEHHSIRWKRLGDFLGKKWGITVERLCDDAEIVEHFKTVKKVEKSNYKYELYCPHCGVVVARYKTMCDAVKHPERWRHKSCKTKLESREITD